MDLRARQNLLPEMFNTKSKHQKKALRALEYMNEVKPVEPLYLTQLKSSMGGSGGSSRHQPAAVKVIRKKKKPTEDDDYDN